jgi:sulfite reductase alpha subunit-like flavoprotein
VYVQDLVEQDSFRVWDLVEKQKAWVYISGLVVTTLCFLCAHFLSRSSNKMPAAVKAAIKKAAVSEGSLSDEEATKYLSVMEWEGRLYEECWS